MSNYNNIIIYNKKRKEWKYIENNKVIFITKKNKLITYFKNEYNLSKNIYCYLLFLVRFDIEGIIYLSSNFFKKKKIFKDVFI